MPPPVNRSEARHEPGGRSLPPSAADLPNDQRERGREMAALPLEIEKVVYGGDGLARLPPVDGRREVVFVPFTLPGERVLAEIEPAVRGRRTARLLEVLRPAPERVAPACEYFGRCGGCQLQHAAPEAQLAIKRAILLETLRRTGGIEWPGELAVHAAAPWAYRNRIRLQAVPGVGVGFHEAAAHLGASGGRHQPSARPLPPIGARTPGDQREPAQPKAAVPRLLPITHCPVASPAINRGLAALAAAPPERRVEIELAVDNDDQGLESDEPLEFAVSGIRYRVSAGAFFQVNRFLAGELVEAATAGASGAAAVDLFSGVGLFALPLAARFAAVEAVENSPQAVRDLRHNARAAANLSVVAAPALAYLRQRAAERPTQPLDLLVADPPRAGLGRDLVDAILAQAPARLHLVSCDPATLGRDLRWLLAGDDYARYELEALHLFDLFPQTYHLETVARLRRVAHLPSRTA